MMQLIRGYQFDQNSADKWSWTLASNGKFTVKRLSIIIEEQDVANTGPVQGTILNSLVPKKLEIFVWRVQKKRLPVRVELDKRGIDLHSVRCPMCDDSLKSVEHSIIFCREAINIWNKIFNWWGLGTFSNLSLEEILKGNGPVSTSSLGKKIWQSIEWVSAYYVWRNRNNKVFEGTSWPASVLLSEIQIKSHEWISQRVNGKKIEWLMWLSNPKLYLNIW
ncbi:uncharacterized protein [Rutidosis leptorrhynchoides]|uniref:uncharacterized protein n=1 Tax=Rutidosis leptorrhynchoides TaxID=125765 RepID=UPI003A99F290